MTPWDLAKSGTEAGEQRALFCWANMAERCGIRVANDPLAYTGMQAQLNGIPQLHWLHAIKNVEKGGAKRGADAKAEGVKAGVADLFLPVSVHETGSRIVTNYHGLYIEMKKLVGGRPSKEQLEFAEYCQQQRYAHYFCKGWIEARDCIVSYLGLA